MSGLTAQQLHDRLKPLQEAKGYFFNADEKTTMELIEGLISNRDRFGYMC